MTCGIVGFAGVVFSAAERDEYIKHRAALMV